MTDTESRLRDYLDAKAATVPPNEQGPGLLADVRRHRPVWPLLATAASVAAVLALTVTVLTHVGPDKPAPASNPAARPQGVPFTVIDAKGKVTLYDGDRKVQRPANIDSISARVGDGWVAGYYKEPHANVVILKADGTYRAIGPEWSDTPVVSPDGKQIAMVVHEKRGADSGRLAVFDVASGAEVATVPLPKYQTALSGWNSTGIWINSHDFGPPFIEELRVWRPGTPEAQQVPISKGTSAVATRPDTATVAITTDSGKKQCIQAASLKDGRLEVEREYCDSRVQAAYPVVSTDGQRLLHSLAKVVIDVPTGKTTKLKLQNSIVTWPKPIFEDATHVLVVTSPKGYDFPQQLHRCDALTGDCTLLRTEKNKQIVLLQP
ncbi:hypothetical protein ACI2LF_20035 [Kribbella sp. NPDC020789]